MRISLNFCNNVEKRTILAVKLKVVAKHIYYIGSVLSFCYCMCSYIYVRQEMAEFLTKNCNIFGLSSALLFDS